MFKIKNKLLPTNRLELFPRSQAEYHIHQEKELLRTENTDLGLMVEVILSMSDRNEISRKKIKESMRKKDLEGGGWA